MCRAAFIAALAALSPAAAQDMPALSGYYKNLLIRSDTVFPAGQSYALDLNRLRLEVKGKFAEATALDLQYDNEVLLGSYLRTEQFRIQKDQRPPQYWDAESNYAESRSYYGRHRLYRAAVTFSSGNADLRIGRQRIAWGTGRFWSPLDILNPFSPIALEREERIGVDAALAEYKLGALARLSAVYAPQHERRDASAALRWQANTAGIDHALVAGRFARDRVLGADIATQIGDAGLRAELTRTRRAAGERYWRALLGADYAFANTLTLGAELYYDGAGASDPQRYDFASLFAGRIQNVGRRYVGAYAGYEITPLLKWNNYFAANLDDRSSYFAPSLVYSLRTNLDLTLGAQRFRGGEGSEFARFADAWYAQLQWFF
jgi:hypothetical protein